MYHLRRCAGLSPESLRCQISRVGGWRARFSPIKLVDQPKQWLPGHSPPSHSPLPSQLFCHVPLCFSIWQKTLTALPTWCARLDKTATCEAPPKPRQEPPPAAQPRPRARPLRPRPAPRPNPPLSAPKRRFLRPGVQPSPFLAPQIVNSQKQQTTR